MIRKICRDDKEIYIEMAKEFYSTDAVIKPIPEIHYERTFDEMMRSDEYIEAYIFEYEGNTAGYALLAKQYSQEAGGMVLWIDELFILKNYRRKGIADEFFYFLNENHSGSYARFRLEAEDYNRPAIDCYKKHGFSDMPYIQLVKDCRAPLKIMGV